MKLNRMPKIEVRSLCTEINGIFSSSLDLTGFAVFSNNKNRIFVSTSLVESFLKLHLNIEKAGLYFASRTHAGEIRLTIEGSQVVFQSANKNIFHADKNQIMELVRGIDIDYSDSMKTLENGFVLVVYENDCYGCGRFTGKKIVNYVKKSNRIKNLKESLTKTF